MYHKIREAQQGDREEGFTLIELLVVVIIIGILAAIAIPVFLNQRQKARNSAANSDLRNMITAQEAYYTEKDNYTSNVADLEGAANEGFNRSTDVLICTKAYASSQKFGAVSYHKTGNVYFGYDSAVGDIKKESSLADAKTAAGGTAGGACEPAA